MLVQIEIHYISVSNIISEVHTGEVNASSTSLKCLSLLGTLGTLPKFSCLSQDPRIRG